MSYVAIALVPGHGALRDFVFRGEGCEGEGIGIVGKMEMDAIA
jgi:hypothetical protein